MNLDKSRIHKHGDISRKFISKKQRNTMNDLLSKEPKRLGTRRRGKFHIKLLKQGVKNFQKYMCVFVIGCQITNTIIR